MKQNVIFGIDVSSKSSTVCVVMDRIKQGATFTITNDSTPVSSTMWLNNCVKPW